MSLYKSIIDKIIFTIVTTYSNQYKLFTEDSYNYKRWYGRVTKWYNKRRSDVLTYSIIVRTNPDTFDYGSDKTLVDIYLKIPNNYQPHLTDLYGFWRTDLKQKLSLLSKEDKSNILNYRTERWRNERYQLLSDEQSWIYIWTLDDASMNLRLNRYLTSVDLYLLLERYKSKKTIIQSCKNEFEVIRKLLKLTDDEIVSVDFS